MLSRNNIVLTKLFLKLDFRNSEDSGMKKLIGMLVTYLFINSLISLGNFQKFDMNVFIFSSLTINLFLVGFVIVSNYADLFFNPKHSRVLSNLPVKEENVFVSKISSAFVYLSVYPFVVTLPPAVYIYFYNHSISEALMFAFISFSFSYFIIGFVFLVNSLIIIRSKTKNRTLLFILQILFIAFIFYINKYSAGNSGELLNDYYVRFLPQYYLLLSYYNAYYLSIFILITLLLFTFIYVFLKQNFLRLSSLINVGDISTERRRTFLPKYLWFERITPGNNIERASFNLVKNHLRNTSILKFRLIPVLFLPLVATTATVFSGMNGVLFLSVMPDSELLVLSPAITMTLLISSRLMLSNLVTGFEEDEDIFSLYLSLPIEDRFTFQKGVLRFVHLYFIIPLVAVCGFVISIEFWSIDIVYNLLYVLLFIFLINTTFAKLNRNIVFSIPPSKFNNSSKYLQLLVSMSLGILLLISQIFVFKNFIFFIITIFTILSLTILLNKIFK